MTTIVNTPGNGGGDGGAGGLIAGVIIAIVIVVLFFVYGLPAIRANKAPAGQTNINVQVPSPVAPDPTTPAQ